ncbi:hypothetical protein ACWIVU_11230, partial [Ursidibacter arcticus]
TIKDLNVTNHAKAKDLEVTNKTKTKDLEVTGNSTLGNTTIGGTGKTFNVTNGTKIDMGGNKVENITSGEIKAGDNNAITGGVIHNKLQELSTNATVYVGNNSGVKVKRSLGAEMQIVGTGTLADDKYSGKNVKTVGTQDGGIEIRFSEAPEFKELNVTGEAKIKDLNVTNKTKTKDLEVTNNATIKDLNVTNKTKTKDLE